MERACFGCAGTVGPAEGEGTLRAVTHGLCDACRGRMESGGPRSWGMVLEGIPSPTIALSPEGRVRYSNAAALELSGKGSPAEALGHLPGGLLGCMHASSKEGCGNTPHCEACAIRNAVSETAKTGRSLARIPTSLNLLRWGGVKPLAVAVSTERAGTSVLVKVEEIH